MVNAGIPSFYFSVLSFSNKKIHYNRADQQFFNAPCKRVTSSLQKRKHHKTCTAFHNREVKKIEFLNADNFTLNSGTLTISSKKVKPKVLSFKQALALPNVINSIRNVTFKRHVFIICTRTLLKTQ